MKNRAMTKVAEASIRNARENRDEVSRWLAAEVLLADLVALEDDELAERLLALQDRLEAQARMRYGLSGKPCANDLGAEGARAGLADDPVV